MLCSQSWAPGKHTSISLRRDSLCGNANGKAQSAKIFFAKAGTTIYLQDDEKDTPQGTLLKMTILKDLDEPIVITDLEKSFRNEAVDVSFQCSKMFGFLCNLNGHVSQINVVA